MSELHKSVLKARLPPRVPRTFNSSKKKTYIPTPWNEHFHEYKDVELESGKFRVYLSSLPDSEDRPRLVMMHGGGYSGLSWSLFSTIITQMIHCQVIAVDFRGHGNTFTADDNDLSAETLTKDIVNVLEDLFSEHKPPVVLIGHSMGGAIAVRVANTQMSFPVIGLAVIDVVEGTAMDSLSSMQSFLRGRPAHFKSIEHAIEWCVRSGQTRNTDSARVSMPGQIMNTKTGVIASSELENYHSMDEDDPSSMGPPAKRLAGVVISDSIAEEPQDDEEFKGPPVSAPVKLTSAPTLSDGKNYMWRIDLSKTEKYWPGWFQGLSEAFLNVPAPKMLLLACISGLDRELTVGQMQGKFQMQVLTKCGHAVHEDNPDEVAHVVASFLIRHKFTEPISLDNTFISMPGC